MEKKWKSSCWSSTTDGGWVVTPGGVTYFCPPAGSCALEVPAFFQNFKGTLFPAKTNHCSAVQGDCPPQDFQIVVPEGNSVYSSQLHPWCCPIFTSIPPSLSSSRFFCLPCLFSWQEWGPPACVAQGGCCKGTTTRPSKLRPRQGGANHVAEQTQPGCQPMLSCCGWSDVLCYESRLKMWHSSCALPASPKQAEKSSCLPWLWIKTG